MTFDVAAHDQSRKIMPFDAFALRDGFQIKPKSARNPQTQQLVVQGKVGSCRRVITAHALLAAHGARPAAKPRAI